MNSPVGADDLNLYASTLAIDFAATGRGAVCRPRRCSGPWVGSTNGVGGRKALVVMTDVARRQLENGFT